MIRVKIKFVVEDVDRHGNIRLYFRRRGLPKLRLPGPLGCEAFWEAYRSAMQGASSPKPIKVPPKASPESFRWLCEAYFRSAEYKQLSDRTRDVRRRVLDRYCLAHGSKPYAQLEPRHIRIQRDEMADRPEAANQLVKLLRQVLSFAVAYDYLRHNPANDVPYISSKSSGFHAWTVDEVRKFEDTHPVGTTARLALALLLYTGQRRSDVVAFGRQHVKDGTLVFTQHKGRDRKPVNLTIPIIPELQQIIDATTTGHLVFLATQTMKPFTSNGFGNRFRKWCDSAGLPHCSAHGLRKAGQPLQQRTAQRLMS